MRDGLAFLLPILVEQTKVVSIPQVEHSDRKIHYIIDAFELPIDDCLPSFIEARMTKGVVLGLRDEIKDEFRTTATLVSHEAHFDVENVPFCYRRKMGFPRMSDYGLMDIKTKGRGISTQIKMDYFPESPHHTFVARVVSVYVDEIQFRIHGSKHDRMYGMFKKAIANTIRGQITESFEMIVRDWVKKVDAFITPRKVQYGSGPKPAGLSQFETFLGAAGLVEKETSAEAVAGESDLKEKRRRDEAYRKSMKSKILSPWESDVFGRSR